MWGKMIIDHYDNLSFDEKEYYNKIYYGILKGKDSIRLLGLFDAKVLDKIIMVLKYEHAEIFYVDFQRMEYVITPEELIYYTINEQIQNIAQKKDTLCRRMYN